MINGTSVLFGPYGTRLEEIEREKEIKGFSKPGNILNGPSYRKAIEAVAGGYVRAGATVVSTNTFGVRGELHKTAGGEKLFAAIAQGHHEALSSVVKTAKGKVVSVMSCGPQNDCYKPQEAPHPSESADFHGRQAYEAHRLGVDVAWFETVSTIDEAIGIALAARKYKIPALISFVLNNKNFDGNLLSGENPRDAIRVVDEASNKAPVGYGFNCCAIESLEPALIKCGRYAQRVKALYPNASSFPQNELNDAALNDKVKGVIDEAGVSQYLHYLAKKYTIAVIGGCCGFNEKNIASISQTLKRDIFRTQLPLTDHFCLTQEQHEVAEVSAR